MDKQDCFDLEELIKIRRYIHKNAEIGYKEVKTGAVLKEYIEKRCPEGVKFVDMAETGFIFDIRGKAEPTKEEPQKDKIVAFRADMDALLMKENNPDLPYQSITEGAHMCGHDGHMVCLLGGFSKLMNNLHKLPSNRIARFILQPGEEAHGGALRMIKENCLEGVSEIWGFHNIPWDPIGQVTVKGGAFFAGIRQYDIIAKGKGGHSSLKKQLKNPVIALSQFNVWFEEAIATELEEENEKLFTVCFATLESSTSHNVIPDQALLSGLLRYLNKDSLKKVGDVLEKVAERVRQKYDIEIEVKVPCDYKLLENDTNLANELKRIIPEATEERVPIMAGEDFSEFSDIIPGCFFLYSVGSKCGKTLHTDNYDFNDDCIEGVSETWFKIMKDRLDIAN